MSQSIQPRILIADDDEDIARLVITTAQEAGFHTQYVTDGLELLKVYDSFHPDYIVLDISMPNMDGIEALSLLNKTGKEANIIIVSGQQAYREWAEKMGVARNISIIANISKPFRIAELRKVLSGAASAFWNAIHHTKIQHSPR